MKKIKFLLAAIVVFLIGVVFVNAQEIAEITNLSIDQDGNITFDPVDGATYYWIGINGNCSQDTDNFNIMRRIADHCQYEELTGYCRADYAGSYAFSFEASNGSILAEYYAILDYDGESFTLRQQDNLPLLVMYDTMGGSLVDWEIVPYGERAHKPNDPNKEGKIFGGWYTEYEEEYDFDDPVEEKLVLHANWVDFIEIDSFEIKGIVQPRDGQKPSTANISIPTKGVNIREVGWYLDEPNWQETGTASKFVKGKKYMLVIDLQLDEGYVFAEGFDEDSVIYNLEPLKSEFVGDRPDVRIYYEAKSAPTKPATPTLLNPNQSNVDNENVFLPYVGYSNGYYMYELGVNFAAYVQGEGYKVDGYEVYEKADGEYILVGAYEMGTPANVSVELGTSTTYVARVYNDIDGTKIYSDYSKELVLNHKKPSTPKLINPAGTFVSQEGNTYTYELGVDSRYYILGSVFEGEPNYVVTGYELYDKVGEDYLLIDTYEMGNPAIIDVEYKTTRTVVARVFATNSDFERIYSKYSNEIELDHKNLPVTKPVVKVKKGTNNTLELSWGEIEYAGKYAIYQSTDNKNWTKLDKIKETSYTVKDLTYGKKYYYKVKAYNDKYNKTSDVVTGTPKPNKMVLNITSAGTNNVKLAWDKVKVTGYRIYQSTDNKEWTLVKDINSNSTLELNVKSLKANKTYYFRARAYKTVSGEKVYGSYSDVVSTKSAPEKSNITLKLLDYKSFSIEFSTPKGATYYKVQGDYVEEFNSPDLFTETLNSDELEVFTSDDAEMGVTYYFRVKACNAQNRCSGWSTNSIKVTPPAPSLKVESTTAKKVTVKVGYVEGADGYMIYRSTSKNSGFELIKQIKSSDSLTFTDKTKSGVTYYYRVKAFTYADTKIKGPYSSIKKVVSK